MHVWEDTFNETVRKVPTLPKMCWHCLWKFEVTYSAFNACNAERCNTYSNSVCLSVRPSVCHTLVPYPDD